MRAVLPLGILLGLAGTALAEVPPALRKGTPYAKARAELMRLGWQPARLPDADACPAGDARCAGRPEMLACSGTGVAACVFTWRRGGVLIEVGTVGEEAPSVSGVRCRSGCR